MFKRFIESIPIDKLKHLAVGVVYSALIVILGILFGHAGALIGVIVGTLLNLFKEVYHDNYQGKGKMELLDFIYNEVPIILVYLAYLL